VLNIVQTKRKNPPKKIFKKKEVLGANKRRKSKIFGANNSRKTRCWEQTTAEKRNVESQQQQKSNMLGANDRRKARCWKPMTEKKRDFRSQRQKKNEMLGANNSRKSKMLGAKDSRKSMTFFAYSSCTLGTKRKGMEAAIITELAEEGWQWFHNDSRKSEIAFAFSCSCGHSWQTWDTGTPWHWFPILLHLSAALEKPNFNSLEFFCWQ
jgi:hypothetical protein